MYAGCHQWRRSLQPRLRLQSHHLVAFVFLLAITQPICLHAQLRMLGGVWLGPGQAAGQTNNGFLLPSLSSDGAEAMQDYYRHRKNGRWEKAFKSLDAVLKASRTGLVSRPDGILVPAQVIVQHALADLPADGRAAYRLFHDAEAKKLLGEAVGANEVPKLEAIIASYMATSPGPAAADRLGDLQFERGNMEEAAVAYRAVLNFAPEGEVSRPLVLLKLGITLARATHWTDVDDVRQELERSYAGQKVSIGGVEVDPAGHLEKLADGKTSAVFRPALLSADVVVPQGGPLWQFRPFGKPGPGKAVRAPAFQDPWGRTRRGDLVFPAAADGKRVYSNILGCVVALDLTTGKLIWRTSSPQELLQLNNRGRVAPEAYTITVIGDSLWITARETTNPQMSGSLKRLDLATGKETLNSKNVSSLTSWLFDSQPAYDGQRLYAGASKKNSMNEVHVLAIQPADGKVLWSTQIGSKKVDENQFYYYVRSAQPAVVVRGGKVYIDTNCGAFAQLDAATGKLEWAVTYESEVPNNNYDYEQVLRNYYAGAPVAEGGRLYFKPMRANRLLAIDSMRPALLWSRPVTQESMLVGVDAERIYMSGDELTAYSIESKRLLWACPIPSGTSAIRPLLTAHRIYQFTMRGVYEIEKETGRVLNISRGADLQSVGGTVLLAAGKLVTTSNMAITAYETKPVAAERRGAQIRQPEREVSVK